MLSHWNDAWEITGRNGEKVVSSTGSFTYQHQADAERDRVKAAAPYAIAHDVRQGVW